MLCHVEFGESIDRRWRNLQAILEQSVLEQTLSIPPRVRSFEVNPQGIHAVNLLVGISVAIPHRDNQEQQFGMWFGYLREDLDEVVCPVLPRILFGVGQTVEPWTPENITKIGKTTMVRVSGSLMYDASHHRSYDKDAQGIVDSMGVAFYEPLYDRRLNSDPHRKAAPAVVPKSCSGLQRC
jgi:hypothetical protein